MRIFDKEHKLIKIVCNQCGAAVNADGEIVKKDFLNVTKEWGYFSAKDAQLHRFDLCEACYDCLIKTFKIPVDIETQLELL